MVGSTPLRPLRVQIGSYCYECRRIVGRGYRGRCVRREDRRYRHRGQIWWEWRIRYPDGRILNMQQSFPSWQRCAASAQRAYAQFDRRMAEIAVTVEVGLG